MPGRLVLLGHPVAHSISPAFQNAALRAAGIPLRYEALDIEPGELSAALQSLIGQHAAGNVTIPHKEAVFRACGRHSDVAGRTRAVNTFWVEDDVLVGDNTDVAGFAALAREALHVPLATGSRVALLGAGGAAAAVLAETGSWPGVQTTVVARTSTRAQALAARFSACVLATDDLAAAVRSADLVVNATPLGLRDDDPMPAALDMLSPAAVVLDLVCRRGETAWVRAARARGHTSLDGLPMLLEQGAVAFTRWFDREPDRAAMRAAVAG